MNKEQIQMYRQQLHYYLVNELLPFWLDRCKDLVNGDFITHFDKNCNDTGEDQKSLIAQARTIYTMALAHRAGYGNDQGAEFACYGVDYLIEQVG